MRLFTIVRGRTGLSLHGTIGAPSAPGATLPSATVAAMIESPPTRTLVTAALPYANGPAHLGHMAGAYLPADIYSRYARLQGRDVLFICGSDEHGVAIMMRARQEGVTPKEI